MDPFFITLLCGVVSIVFYLVTTRPKKSSSIPAKMRRLVVVKASGLELKDFKVTVDEVAMPKPGKGEVLVRMVATAVNPSDQAYLRLAAEDKPELKEPTVFGREGCGVVVATGGGWMANRLMGKKVGVASMEGTWQEYVCVPAKPPTACTLDQSLPTETAASFFVNPLTAVGLCDVAKRKGSPAFIHTVGNSQLGMMMVKLAKSQGVTIVNMVRKEEGRKVLEYLGAEHIVVTSREGWQDQLKVLIDKLNISVVFDAIAGDMTGTMMGLLPEKSSTVVYGGLASRTVSNLPVIEMIYGNKKMEAFFLRTWMMEGGFLRMLWKIRSSFKLTMPALAHGEWAETKFDDCRLETMWENMCDTSRGANKLRIRMD